jgi:hypothetical protein
VSHTTMKTNVVTPSRNSAIPTTVVTTGELSSPNPPSSVRATMVSTATTLHSGPIPSLAAATTPFTPSATGPPFSYRMPSSGTSHVLSYSILYTLGLGAGSSSAPLQGHIGGRTFPSSGMSIWVNSFDNQWNPRQTTMPIPTGLAWGNPSQSPSNIMHAQPSMSYLGNQSMMSPHMQNPYTGQGHGFY